MINTSVAIFAQIQAAKVPTDLFPSDEVKAHEMFRQLAAALHPDRQPAAERPGAEETMGKLTALWAAYNNKGVASAPAVVGPWVVVAPLHRGAFCDLYRVSRADTHQAGVLKIARHPRDNDLVKREAETLKHLESPQTAADPRLSFGRYLPRLLDTFEASYRRAVVTELSSSAVMSLAEIRRLHPRGIPFRHIVWMMNRLLSVLGYLHQGPLVIHGAVLPQHLLYHIEDHGLTLLDFTASVRWGDNANTGYATIPYLVNGATYPPEVLGGLHAPKGWAHPATDVAMAFTTMRAMSADDMPPDFYPMFEWATFDSWRSRPADAWQAQDRWTTLAAKAYGPPTFVPLVLPAS